MNDVTCDPHLPIGKCGHPSNRLTVTGLDHFSPLQALLSHWDTFSSDINSLRERPTVWKLSRGTADQLAVLDLVPLQGVVKMNDSVEIAAS